MEWIYPLILVGAGLILVSVFTCVLAFRFGAPLLLVFLCLGLIAGEDGLGLSFDSADTAYFVASLALAVILFDSGFGTRARALRQAAAPAIVLATVGVLLTTVIVGAGARFIFDLPWSYALLMGAIVSSTDAAAVFFLLRVGGIRLNERVQSVLEIESGSNDPMAIFLTIFFVELIISGMGAEGLVSAVVAGFGQQMGLGLLFGLLGGFLIVQIINRVRLEHALYPIAVVGAALVLFALTGLLGGSGFLAVYIAGVFAGNRPIVGGNRLRRYQEGMTWLAQIVMFLVLGLLATPSELLPLALPGIALALFLIFVARPVAVWLCLLPFPYRRRSITFISWVGLRGAVSILLAIVPLISGVDDSGVFFNVAFIVVLTSLLVQGWTIRLMARWLHLMVPSELGPVERVELELPGAPRHQLAVYKVVPESAVIQGARLPRWARPSLIVRQGQSIRYQQAGDLLPGDFVYIFVIPEYVHLLDRIFASPRAVRADDKEFFGELKLNPDKSLGELRAVYGIEVAGINEQVTIAEYMRRTLGGRPITGDRVAFGSVELVVRKVENQGQISDVGLAIMTSARAAVHDEKHTLYARIGRAIKGLLSEV